MLVAAGGTGGHLFPAEALAAALAKRGIAVELATDHRAAQYSGAFRGAVHVIPSATIRGRDPISLAQDRQRCSATASLKAWLMLPSIKPSVVVGFGGYPSIPPVLAASLRGIPTVIHEQNAVMGRANRFLAPRVSAIATGFAGVLDKDPALAAKATLHRQSGAAGGDRWRRRRPIRRPMPTARCSCWCSAAARARA